MKQFSIYSYFLAIFFMIFGCEKKIDEPIAMFRIEKDTIIDHVKTRIVTNVADTINPVYFVYEGSSNFNSVWPGDTVYKPMLTIRTPPDGKIARVNYAIYQDYDTRKDTVLLSYSKNDSLNTQYKIVYQGLSLPYGSREVQYTYETRSGGPLTVTWVSTDENQHESKTTIYQKTITVK